MTTIEIMTKDDLWDECKICELLFDYGFIWLCGYSDTKYNPYKEANKFCNGKYYAASPPRELWILDATKKEAKEYVSKFNADMTAVDETPGVEGIFFEDQPKDLNLIETHMGIYYRYLMEPPYDKPRMGPCN